MSLTGVPEDAAQIASIEVGIYFTEHGEHVAYGLDGLSPEAAIGYLTVVQDRLREERSYQWNTCPGCGEPWSDHFDDEDDDE